MFLRIMPNNVKEFFEVDETTSGVDNVYVVKCSVCNEEIKSWASPDEVCSVANMLGWVYDNVQGRIICNKCFEGEQEDPIGK